MPIPLEKIQREHIISRILPAMTTVAELLSLFKDQPRPHDTYAIIRISADAYDVLQLADLSDIVMQQRAAILPLPLQMVPGLLAPHPPVRQHQIGLAAAERQQSSAPRRRIVILDDTDAVIGLLISTYLATPKSPIDPLALISAGEVSTLIDSSQVPLATPYLNTRFDGVGPSEPLIVGRRVPLIVSVGPSMTSQMGKSAAFRFDFTHTTGTVTFVVHVDADPEMWTIHTVESTLIVNPVQTAGYTSQEAKFLITAKYPGRDKLHISVERADTGTTVQHVWLPVVVAHEHTPAMTAPVAYERTEVSLPLDSSVAERRQVELTIQPGDEGFRAVVRADLPGQSIRETYHVPVSAAEIQNATQRLRQALQKIVFYQTTVNGQMVYPFASRTDLTVDEELARTAAVPLADAGEQVWRLLFNAPRAPAALRELAARLRELPSGSTVRIVLDSRQFIVPWALLYDKPGPITGDTLDWSGFWGYRYILDTLPPGSYPPPQITVAPPSLLFLLNDDANLRQFTEVQAQFAQHQLTNAKSSIAWGHADIQHTLAEAHNAAFVYCYCHGDHKSGAISVGQLASESAVYFSGQQQIRLADLRRLPAAPFPQRPLVFLNACEGATQDAFYYDGFMPFFIEELGARGFIGTEVQAPQLLAHDVALRFFSAFARGQAVGDILWQLRRHYLDVHHNILGFNYTLYCLGDVRFAQPLQGTEGR